MNIGRAAGLILLLMNSITNAEDTISSFIRDMMATFQLSSPTIVYDGDEVPEICYTDQWMLCLPINEREQDILSISAEEVDKGQVALCH